MKFWNYKMHNANLLKTIFFALLFNFYCGLAQTLEDEKWTYNKILPFSFEEEAIEVLKYYPELKATYIRFQYKRLPDAIMQVQPTWWSLIFKKKENRKYKIFINILPSIDAPLESFPKNVIKGIFAHEYAHIVYYQQNSNIRLILDFIRYPINCPFKKEFERNADIIAIQHGLGVYLKEAWQYTGFDANLSDVMKAKKRFYYLSPLEIQKLMSQYSKKQ